MIPRLYLVAVHFFVVEEREWLFRSGNDDVSRPRCFAASTRISPRQRRRHQSESKRPRRRSSGAFAHFRKHIMCTRAYTDFAVLGVEILGPSNETKSHHFHLIAIV
jgi:hypothetical protein